MGPRDAPAKSSSADPSALLAALAPLPSAIPTDSDLSTGCSPGPLAQHSVQTAVPLPAPPPLAFPMDAPLPTLALPVTHLPTSTRPAFPLHPHSAPLAQPDPPPASVLSADLQPLRSCQPLFSQTPAPYFQTLQKLGLCARPPHVSDDGGTQQAQQALLRCCLPFDDWLRS